MLKKTRRKLMKVLVTGCAGFIGCHSTKHFLDKGDTVVGIDNLSRKGGSLNFKWLNKSDSEKFKFYQVDIRDYNKIVDIFRLEGEFDLIIHLAGQVAVTTSVVDPREDFEINALGTFNILEATRIYSKNAFFEFASTNKVYGKMTDIPITERNGRYEYEKLVDGIKETYGLDFYSPYGCSKGTADQYVLDYARIYGLRTVVLRQSCIYGTRQFGIEDQGWVAWFTIASVLNQPITIFGDGKQIRDVLWIDDLVNAYQTLFDNSKLVSGEAFNIGGGKDCLMSLLELVEYLEQAGVRGEKPAYSDWRPGDQKVFVCDTSKLKKMTGWAPTIEPKNGVAKIIDWTNENKEMVRKIIL
jgi:CDP-paratose 2-epimerase